MDIMGQRSIEIASLAMDGLSARHKAIASNIANADSPNYKRVDVSFEDQLRKIIETDDKEHKRKFNGKQENSESNKNDFNFSDFNPETIISKEDGTGKNNVDVEREMADLSKNGTRYNALAILQQKAFRELLTVIQYGGRA